jgi:hypothetical protein
MVNRQAAAYHLTVTDDALVAEIESADWLPSAVLAVANASARAAHAAAERVVAATEIALKERILSVLMQYVPPARIAKEYKLVGASGKQHTFDFAVQYEKDGWLVLDAVAPHHVSIAAKYVAFSDTRNSELVTNRFAVFDRQLEKDDISLLQQVADLVPFKALPDGVKREFPH